MKPKEIMLLKATLNLQPQNVACIWIDWTKTATHIKTTLKMEIKDLQQDQVYP